MHRGAPSLFVIAIAIASGLLVEPTAARAESNSMDPFLEATLQLKVQSYDRKIAQRLTHKRFVVGIVYKAGVRASEASANEMRDAFARVVETYRIKGVKPTILTIAYDKAKFVETLTSQDVAMVYIARGVDDGLPAVLAATARLKIPSVSGVREYVTSGCTIGIVVDRRKPKIVVNLTSVEATGMQLEAEMLELAEVVR